MFQEFKNLWNASSWKAKIAILIPMVFGYVCAAIVTASFVTKCIF